MDLLIALNEQEEVVTANRGLCKAGFFYCPSCKGRVCLKVGEVKRAHFAHYRNESCDVFSEGETKEHLDGKIQIFNYLQRRWENVQLEAYLPNLQQRPDVLFQKENRKIAVEFQCSSISIEKIVERTKGYLNANYEVIWILGKCFKYTRRLTALHKAFLYHNLDVGRSILFHYDAKVEELTMRYDFQMSTYGRINCQTKKIRNTENEYIKLPEQKKCKIDRNSLEAFEKKHKQLMREIRYPSPKTNSFLELLYHNEENIISMPKELYIYFPSEWMIQDFRMNWKYRFVLWIESYPKKRLLTMKMLETWLGVKMKKKEINYFESPQLEKKEQLKPFIELINHLENQGVLKEIGQQKWSYQKPLKRYRNLEEKFMEE